jgi:hypothetical protein
MRKGENQESSRESELPDGERWLTLLGREELIGTPIPYYKDGRQLRAEEFPELDREAVLPIFTLIESLPLEDPIRAEKIEAANAALDYWLNQPGDGS